MQKYGQKTLKKWPYFRNTAKKDQAAFIQDVIEDLNQLDQSRIAGLGLTPEQLKIWLKLNKSHDIKG